MIKLVLLRHGESTWNLENRFTGWTDVDLTPKGIEEAHEAARLLREGGYTFDVAYTSLLEARDPHALDRPRRHGPDVDSRSTGAGGSTSATTARCRGSTRRRPRRSTATQQVLVWRRSYADPPPPLTADDERHPGHDRRYADLAPDELPLAESLKDTVARFLPYWHGDDRPRRSAPASGC